MTIKDQFWRWLAWQLPRPLVYWATIRLCAHATVAEYSDTEPDKLRVFEVLERWG